MGILTLAEAKLHLRVDQSAEDALINIYMEAAEDYIGKFLGGENFPIESAIKAAALLIIGDMYENREGAGEKIINENPAVMRLLYPYRKCIGI